MNGYGYNASYVLKQNTLTDVVLNTWTPTGPMGSLPHASTSYNSPVGALTLPGAVITNWQQRSFFVGGSSFNFADFSIGSGVSPTANLQQANCSIYLNIRKYSSNLSSSSNIKRVIATPITTGTTEINARSQLQASLSTNNCYLSFDGKLLQVRLLASDLDTPGFVELSIEIYGGVSTFPFEPTTFYVTADGYPPAQTNLSSALLTSIQTDTTAIRQDTNTIIGTTNSIKSDTTTLKSDASTIKTNLLTVQSDVSALKKATVNNTKIDVNTNIYTVYDDDGITPLYRYDLFNKLGQSASASVYERRRKP
jgi:hypothetical protein